MSAPFCASGGPKMFVQVVPGFNKRISSQIVKMICAPAKAKFKKLEVLCMMRSDPAHDTIQNRSNQVELFVSCSRRQIAEINGKAITIRNILEKSNDLNSPQKSKRERNS